MKKSKVTIYSRPGCHLCEVAKDSILSAGCSDEFTIEEVNIDDDLEGLRFEFDIPVVFINGVKVFKHRVDPAEFRKKLRRLAKLA